MQIYNYHPETGEYLGPDMADPDPLDEGNWLIPAYSTTQEPPQPGVNQTAVFMEGSWKLVADYRGLTYWLPDGSEHTIEDLGVEPPSDALDAPPPPSLEEVQAAKLKEVEQERIKRTAIMLFTLPNGKKIPIKTQEEPPNKPRLSWLIGAATWGQTLVFEGQSYVAEDLIAADDTIYKLTAKEWKELGKALHNWVSRHLKAAKQHEKDIMQYSVREDVENHDLNLYWPKSGSLAN